jgi:hypothetical protein
MANRMRRRAAALLGSIAVGAALLGGAWGAGIWPGFPVAGPPGTYALTGKELIPADTGLAQGLNPATVVIPSAMLLPTTWPKNLLDNGAMGIQQRGTGTVTCAAAAAITSAAYVADRWGCSANVTSGVGRAAVITASPAPPTGFPASVKVWRLSGALTQPVCLWQETPSVETTFVAGQTMTLSAYVAGLAGLVADNGGQVNLVVIAGTGTDEGFGTMTASPAITPAWTGITTVVNQAFTGITTTFGRIQVTYTMPATATESAVGICFTPTAAGAGATDGFAVTGVQNEVAPAATFYEFKPTRLELLASQRYFYRITEGAALAPRALCAVSSTSLAVCHIRLPVTMVKTPTVTTTTAGFSLTVAAQTSVANCSAIRLSTTFTSTVATPEIVPIDCTSTTAFGAAGTAAQLFDAGQSGLISASADF